jgi:glutathione S-transferase
MALGDDADDAAKDDLLALTGGYRGTVLQIGADVCIDSQRIARSRSPAPTLFPSRECGIRTAVMGRRVFSRGPAPDHCDNQHAGPAEFRVDRQGLFPDIDFDGIDADYARSQLRAHASFVEQQLADGRRFLGGDAPSLLASVVDRTRSGSRGLQCPAPMAVMPHSRMAAWEQRVADLGEGRRVQCAADDASQPRRQAAVVHHRP